MGGGGGKPSGPWPQSWLRESFTVVGQPLAPWYIHLTNRLISHWNPEVNGFSAAGLLSLFLYIFRWHREVFIALTQCPNYLLYLSSHQPECTSDPKLNAEIICMGYQKWKGEKTSQIWENIPVIGSTCYPQNQQHIHFQMHFKERRKITLSEYLLKSVGREYSGGVHCPTFRKRI